MITLTYPFVSPTTTLSLRSNELTTISKDYGNIVRHTISGELKTLSDWPKLTSFDVKIVALDATEKGNLVTFLSNSQGKEIGILLPEVVQYRGFIVDIPVIELIGRGCQYTIAFKFIGRIDVS